MLYVTVRTRKTRKPTGDQLVAEPHTATQSDEPAETDPQQDVRVGGEFCVPYCFWLCVCGWVKCLLLYMTVGRRKMRKPTGDQLVAEPHTETQSGELAETGPPARCPSRW